VAPDFSGHRLVLPSLATGNVGQLALDVIITTLALIRAGTLYSPYVIPMVGNDAVGSTTEGNLTSTLEVFHLPAKSLVFLQQRAPVVRGKQRQWVKDLLSWFKLSSFSSIVLLGSADKVTLLDDFQLQGDPLRYLAESVEVHKDWLSLEDDLVSQVFRCGTPSTVLRDEAKKSNIPFLALILFVSEGDNRMDGIIMAHHLNQFLLVSDTGKWTPPLSWDRIYNTAPYDRILFM